MDRWKEDGFARIDALIDWARANQIYVILDLHAAPGGQGTDLPIADRDPDAPSLWDSRSEEHTSELQSLMRISYAVFCLKKKKTIYHTIRITPHINYS